MEVRSFLAFELSDEIKDILRNTSREMKKNRLDLRWVKVENIHLTVIFMGNMAVNILDQMDLSIREVCSRYQPLISVSKAREYFLPAVRQGYCGLDWMVI